MMKSVVKGDWMRHLKILLAGTALSLSVISGGTNEAWAAANKQTIQQTIQTLQKSNQRWIQINLAKQRLTAWEGGKRVYSVVISSGKKSTPTRVGSFKIQSKYRTTRMRGEDYDVPNVPYAMFYQGNYGIHGAYWHKRFGTP